MNKKTKKILNRLLTFLCIAVIVICVYKIASEYFVSMKVVNESENLAKNVISSSSSNYDSLDDTNIDFDKLIKINSDTVAWLQIPDTPISYPIVHKPNDTNYYLYRGFDGKSIKYGSIFLDGDNKSNFEDPASFVFGHNIDTSLTLNNKLYFTSLDKYEDPEYLKKHKNIHIFKKDGKKYNYEVFAQAVLDQKTDLYKTNFSSEEEFGKYVDKLKQTFKYKNDALNSKSKLLMLVTCTTPEEGITTRRLVFAFR